MSKELFTIYGNTSGIAQTGTLYLRSDAWSNISGAVYQYFGANSVIGASEFRPPKGSKFKVWETKIVSPGAANLNMLVSYTSGGFQSNFVVEATDTLISGEEEVSLRRSGRPTNIVYSPNGDQNIRWNYATPISGTPIYAEFNVELVTEEKHSSRY